MLKNIFQKKIKKAPLPLGDARIDDDVRVYAIGDIHGRLDLFDELLQKIDEDDAARGKADTLLVLLGDLMDRGPDSRGVIERAMQLKQASPDKVRILAGNHEEVYLGAATGNERMVKFFCRIGGRETILSYDISLEEYRDLQTEDLAKRLPALIPQSHIDFVKSFEDVVVIGDYAFVHAGVRPGVSLEEQRQKDLRWIRDEFLFEEAAHDKIIVHGHSITDDIDECHNRIGIDTGAYDSGVLTALCLQGGDRWYLQTGAAQ